MVNAGEARPRKGGLGRQVAALYFTLLGFYLLTAGGHFYATD